MKWGDDLPARPQGRWFTAVSVACAALVVLSIALVVAHYLGR